VPELIQALNNELRKLEEAVREVRTKPAVSNDLDMAGFRITNLGKSRSANDATPKSEIQERGLFENELGQHVAHSTILAKDGIRSASQARDGDDLVPLRQIRQLIGSGSGGLNALLTTDVDQTALGNKSFYGFGLHQTSFTCVNGNNGILYMEPGEQIFGAFFRIRGSSLTAGFSISGIARSVTLSGGRDGQIIVLHNSTAFPLTLHHNFSGGNSDFRIPQANATATAGMVIRRYGSVILSYGATDNRWVTLSFA